jgi:hypothetical protein
VPSQRGVPPNPVAHIDDSKTRVPALDDNLQFPRVVLYRNPIAAYLGDCPPVKFIAAKQNLVTLKIKAAATIKAKIFFTSSYLLSSGIRLFTCCS